MADDDHLDCNQVGSHVQRTSTNDRVIITTTSCLQNLQVGVQATKNDASSTAELPPRKRRTGELQGGGSY